ncbi:hypothetical protein [Streptococcus dysgalactiae]|uniref:hypothetical protein n=1 Tax=Streptococcus dysgalactiae TaxID=1334 RepID=UPI003DA0AEC6
MKKQTIKKAMFTSLTVLALMASGSSVQASECQSSWSWLTPTCPEEVINEEESNKAKEVGRQDRINGEGYNPNKYNSEILKTAYRTGFLEDDEREIEIIVERSREEEKLENIERERNLNGAPDPALNPSQEEKLKRKAWEQGFKNNTFTGDVKYKKEYEDGLKNGKEYNKAAFSSNEEWKKQKDREAYQYGFRASYLDFEYGKKDEIQLRKLSTYTEGKKSGEEARRLEKKGYEDGKNGIQYHLTQEERPFKHFYDIGFEIGFKQKPAERVVEETYSNEPVNVTSEIILKAIGSPVDFTNGILEAFSTSISTIFAWFF